jgi:hypothetical protein
VRDQYTTITNPKSLFDLFELGGRQSNYDGVRDLATSCKPFNPVAKTRGTLKVAVSQAHAWPSDKYENSYLPPAYYEGSHWHVPIARDVIECLTTFFADPDDRNVAAPLSSSVPNTGMRFVLPDHVQ